MLDISTGKFTPNNTQGWEIAPFLSKNDFINSKFWVDNKQKRRESNETGRTFHFDQLSMFDQRMSMEIRIGRTGFIDEVTLRTEMAANIHQWYSKPDWEERAIRQKKIHDEILLHETNIPSELLTDKDELTIDTDWGSISSVMNLSPEPDIRITIRYRNLSEADKEKYLTLGKKYLHGEK